MLKEKPFFTVYINQGKYMGSVCHPVYINTLCFPGIQVQPKVQTNIIQVTNSTCAVFLVLQKIYVAEKLPLQQIIFFNGIWYKVYYLRMEEYLRKQKVKYLELDKYTGYLYSFTFETMTIKIIKMLCIISRHFPLP